MNYGYVPPSNIADTEAGTDASVQQKKKKRKKNKKKAK